MQTVQSAKTLCGRFSRLLQAACRRDIALSSLRTAVVVGTVLNLINQGHLLVDGLAISGVHALLNFAVPFCVSSYSAARQSINEADSPQRLSEDCHP